MAISQHETIAVSEEVIMLLPSLSQTDLGIVAGTMYRLSFDTVITSGVLKVYQGTQLIYTSASIFIGGLNDLYETVFVTEDVNIVQLYNIKVFDLISIADSVAPGILPVYTFDAVTVTENKALTIV